MKRPLKNLSLRDLLEPLFRYKIALLISIISVSAPISAYNIYRYKTKPLFEAQSKVLIEDTSVNRLISVGGTTSYYNRLESEIELILSKPVILNAIKKIDSKDFSEDKIGLIAAGLSVTAMPKTNVIKVRFRYPDKDVVAPFANALVDEYIFLRRYINSNSASVAAGFFIQEKDNVSKQLQEARETLRAYKNDANLFSTEEQQKIYLHKLEDVRAQLKDVNTQIDTLKKKKIEIQAELKKEDKDIEIRPLLNAAPTIVSKMEEMLLELELKRDERINKFSSNDKEVQLISEKIKLLEDKFKAAKRQTLYNELKRTDLEIEDLSLQKESVSDQLISYSAKIAAIEDKKMILDEYGETISDLQEIRENLIKSIYKVREIGDIEQNGSISTYKFESAQDPASPVEPKPLIYSILGLIASMGFGVVVVSFVNYFDHSVKDVSDITSVLGLQFLASVKEAKQMSKKSKAVAWKSETDVSEACNRIYDSMLRQREFRPGIKTLAVASSRRGEGTSTIASNIATYFTESMGLSVLLIDSDFHKPIQHKLFNVDSNPGLPELVSGKAKASESIKKIGAGKLYIIPSSPSRDSLTPGALDLVIENAKKSFDLIVLDCPAILESPEALYCCQASDVLVLTVAAEKTRVETVDYVNSKLKDSDIACHGVVLNRVKRHIPEWIYRFI